MKKFSLLLGLLSLGYIGTNVFAANCPLGVAPLPTNEYFCANTDVCSPSTLTGTCWCDAEEIVANQACSLVASPYVDSLRITKFTHYIISGSTVTFQISINNTTGSNTGDKYFTLDLPSTAAYGINYLNVVSSAGDRPLNETLISMGIQHDPVFKINAGEIKTYTVTAQVIDTTFTLPNPVNVQGILSTDQGASNVLFTRAAQLFPVVELQLRQALNGSSPKFSGDLVTFHFTLQNIGSRIANGVSFFDQFPLGILGMPSAVFDATARAYNGLNLPNTFVWSGGYLNLNPGQIIHIFVSAPITNQPVNTAFSNIGTVIYTGVELNTLDNSDSVNAIVMPYVDMIAGNVNFVGAQPQMASEPVSFTFRYQNSGNINTSPTATITISGTNISNTAITLPTLTPGQTGSYTVTGSLNASYPAGTQLCFSGILASTNENGTTGNNVFTTPCTTVLGVADVAVNQSLLTAPLDAIQSGSTLTYQIILTNSGAQQATGIILTQQLSSPLSYISTNYGVPSVAGNVITWSNISLNAGQTITITTDALVGNLPAAGVDILSTALATLSGKDLTLANNAAQVPTHLSGLSDVYVSVSLQPFAGFRLGDQLRYILSYGNIGGRSADNVVLQATLPNQLTTSISAWNLGTLTPGQQGTIDLTPTLTSTFSAGNSFTTAAQISTSTAQINTNNDSGSLTTNIPEIDGVYIRIQTNNVTNPSMNPINVADPIKAVSGDVINVIITYGNDGNVAASNVRVGLEASNNFPILTFNPTLTTTTIGTLQPGQSGQIQGTITIPKTNFESLFTNNGLVAKLVYTNGRFVSQAIKIIEPYLCGDGLITKDEQCDTSLSLPAGQICENQNNKCVLKVNLVNRACITYDDGTMGDCVETGFVSPTPRCATVEKTLVGTTTQVKCNAENIRGQAAMQVNCGDGNIFTQLVEGVAGKSFGSFTCPNAGANISCTVGNPADQGATCGQAGACIVSPESDIVIANDTEDGSTKVTCITPNDTDQRIITIDCGNGDKITSDTAGSRFSAVCTYKNPDNQFSTEKISCSLDNSTTSCDTKDLIVDQGILPYCEKDSTSRECDPATSCLSVYNANVSVQKGEILPYWLRLETYKNIIDGSSCRSEDEGDVPRDTIGCTVSVVRGVPGKPEKSEEVYSKQYAHCLENQGLSDALKTDLAKKFPSSLKTQAKGYIDVDEIVKNGQYGEYKLIVKNLTYKVCNGEGTGSKESNLKRLCETNFTVTKPYLVQKSAFGLTPKVGNDLDLRDFYDMAGNQIFGKTDLGDIMVLDASDYKGGSKIKNMMYDFIDTYKKTAVAIKQNSLPAQLRNADLTVKKVPNRNIFFISSDNKTLSIDGAIIETPFTIVLENTNVEIKNDVNVNGMFLAKGGDIKFINSNCDHQQIVRGIFVTDKNFDSDSKQLNTSNSKVRCTEGGLYVQGVLIGNGIDNVIQNRRSNLNHWFTVVSSTERGIRAERRNEIFRGASVLIEYSPSLWEQLPPGAEDFTKALDVYKR